MTDLHTWAERALVELKFVYEHLRDTPYRAQIKALIEDGDVIALYHPARCAAWNYDLDSQCPREAAVPGIYCAQHRAGKARGQARLAKHREKVATNV
jgi:hypothetical protein